MNYIEPKYSEMIRSLRYGGLTLEYVQNKPDRELCGYDITFRKLAEPMVKDAQYPEQVESVANDLTILVSLIDNEEWKLPGLLQKNLYEALAKTLDQLEAGAEPYGDLLEGEDEPDHFERIHRRAETLIPRIVEMMRTWNRKHESKAA